MASHYHQWEVFSRSRGESAISAAAYAARMVTWDKRYVPEPQDYRGKDDLVYSAILVPEGAPGWARDRRKLWTAVERREDRSTRPQTAQLCRGCIVGFQRELTMDQNIRVLLRYLDDQYVADGMIVDVNVHDAPASDGGRNWHAHLLATMREVLPDGFGLKRRDWNEVDFGLRDGLKHHRPFAMTDGFLRQRKAVWADYVNEALADTGSDARIDHRTLKAQGIDRLPQPKMGKAAYADTPWAAQKRDELSDVLAYNRERERRPRKAARGFDGLPTQPKPLHASTGSANGLIGFSPGQGRGA